MSHVCLSDGFVRHASVLNVSGYRRKSQENILDAYPRHVRSAQVLDVQHRLGTSLEVYILRVILLVVIDYLFVRPLLPLFSLGGIFDEFDIIEVKNINLDIWHLHKTSDIA